MERYEGNSSDDQIRGGGEYVKKEGHGHETCNFSQFEGMVYGYVEPPGVEIDLERIGTASGNNSISGVTVVWTAKRPEGGTVVVGWYSDAKVFRTCQKRTETALVRSRKGLDDHIDRYWIEARASNAKLLPIDERTLQIPRGKGGMGQSNIWYANKPESAPVIKEVHALIDGNREVRSTAHLREGNQDQERKAKVEKAAINACSSYYESLGYTVESVEKDNLGWDLQAQAGKSKLRIEVKGLSGNQFAVELTPNEYGTFAERAADYRLAVVTNALEKPELHLCRYSQEQAAWVVEGQIGMSLQIKERVGASIGWIR